VGSECGYSKGPLTIVGGVRDALLVWRLGRGEIMRPRRHGPALLGGPSTSPLEAILCAAQDPSALPLMSTLPFNAKRTIVAVAGLVPLACLINWYFEFNAFGGYDKKVLTGSFIFLAVVMHYFGPTLQEIEEYRRTRSQL
jgi:hypothetical protein